MSTTFFRRYTPSSQKAAKTKLQIELLETRNLMATSTFSLTAISQVSGDSPLAPFVNPSPPAPPTVFNDSEVEPQLAVDPRAGHTDHAVAVWQQDRFRSVGGARALGFSVTEDASNAAGAHWTAPAIIPGFDGTAAGSPYVRYTDPWVSIAPNGDVYASALGLTPTGPLPGHTAVLVTKSTDGGYHWSTPTILYQYDAPAGDNPIDGAVDKESITADPYSSQRAYVAWDRLNMPSDGQNFNAAHSLAFRGDALFSRTLDGGATWETQVIYAPKDNSFTIGHQIVVLPDASHTLVDSFTFQFGSGTQPGQSGKSHMGLMRSSDQGATWTAPILGPELRTVEVVDPDTGAAVRASESLGDFAVDPNSGNLYFVWADGRFSKYDHDDIAFSMSTDGGFTWSDPIKVNQTPVGAAFLPSVAVAANGTVAVTYYDFRNNNSDPGLPTDCWLVHASSNFTNQASWMSDEKRLTNTSFDMEQAPPTSRGYFLGDYMGLSATGNSFYALFAQAGNASDPSSIWFRDPPPAPDLGLPAPVATGLTSSFTPDSATFGSTLDTADLWDGSSGLFENWSNPTSLLSNSVRKDDMSTMTGLDIAAVDQAFASSVWNMENSSTGHSRSSSTEATANGLTDGGSLTTALADSGLEG